MNLKNFNEKYWKQNTGGLQQQHVQALQMISPKWQLNILDVGCGDGTFLEQLPQEWSPKGIDFSNESIKKCRRKGLDVIQHDMHDMGTIRNFDLITLLDVLEHTLTPELVLKEVRKHTQTVILTVPNMAFIKHRMQALLGLVPDECRSKKGHCQYMTKERIEQIIKDSKFTIINTNHYYARWLPKCWASLFATMFCYKILRRSK